MEELTMTPPIDTERSIIPRQDANSLPARGRIRTQLNLLLESPQFEVGRIFRAAARTIVGLPREAIDPQGIHQNYFRIDLQQDPGEMLNIHYQVSASTVANVLVDSRVQQFQEEGVANIRTALLLSFESGTYPTGGLPGSGVPEHIFEINVIKKEEKKKSPEPVSPPPDSEPKKSRRERQRERQAEEEKRRRAALQALMKTAVKVAEYKAIEKASEKALIKAGTKLAAKAGAKSVAKKVPVLGLFVGAAFAVDRLFHGDFAKAGVELASGAVSVVPGAGTAASIAIDIGLAADDLLNDPEARRINEEMENAKSNGAMAEKELSAAKSELKNMGMTDEEIEEQSKNYTSYEAVLSTRESLISALSPDIEEGVYFIENLETKRYLFQDGDKIQGKRGDEKGWLKSSGFQAPSVVGADANYYNRAYWKIIPVGDGKFIIENVETGRYLFQDGKPIEGNRGHEGGWTEASGFAAPATLGVDANYYDRAIWKIIPHGNEIYIFENIETKRYLFQSGDPITNERGDEKGWKLSSGFQAPATLGTDANYYNRAYWKLEWKY